jgi:hypothetical protein
VKSSTEPCRRQCCTPDRPEGGPGPYCADGASQLDQTSSGSGVCQPRAPGGAYKYVGMNCRSIRVVAAYTIAVGDGVGSSTVNGVESAVSMMSCCVVSCRVEGIKRKERVKRVHVHESEAGESAQGNPRFSPSSSLLHTPSSSSHARLSNRPAATTRYLPPIPSQTMLFMSFSLIPRP